MSSSQAAQRIAIFTHDAYGVGHVRRSLHIVKALAERAPHAAILLITGSPATELFKQLPPNADYVKLPTVVPAGAQGTKPPTLEIGSAELNALRSRMLHQTLETFAPDVLLVDNFPLGSRLELLASLQNLRQSSTRMVLGLRDIVDPPKKLRTDWSRDGIYQVVERYYERILVYGVREVLDVADAYALPHRVADRIRYCGYVTGDAKSSRSADDVRAELGAREKLVLATVGGGGDGFPLLQAFLRALPSFPDASAMVVTGEFMTSADRDALGELANGQTNLVMRHFVRDLPSYMAAADVVVAMGGYNTAAEILSSGARAIVVPRTWGSGEHAVRSPRRVDGEQLARAEALTKMELIEMLHPDELGPAGLGRRIATALANPRAEPKVAVNVRGVDRVAGEIMELANGNA